MPPIKNPNLRLLSIRLDKRDMTAARKEAKRWKRPYQHIVRDWVTAGADRVRAAEAGAKVPKKAPKKAKKPAKAARRG